MDEEQKREGGIIQVGNAVLNRGPICHYTWVAACLLKPSSICISPFTLPDHPKFPNTTALTTYQWTHCHKKKRRKCRYCDSFSCFLLLNFHFLLFLFSSFTSPITKHSIFFSFSNGIQWVQDKERNSDRSDRCWCYRTAEWISARHCEKAAFYLPAVHLFKPFHPLPLWCRLTAPTCPVVSGCCE